MRMREFMQKMLEAFPDATVDTDYQGQLIIYTNLREVPDKDKDPDEWELVEFES